jgi:pseudaminic acid cytidylyltransferase
MKIAVIPARGGSKRIPKKNIKEFNGRPMIAWSIDLAIRTGIFDSVVVSTDDLEIANIAKDCGALVPFIRPSNLADDLTVTVPVIAHAISEFNKLNILVSYACCIYPCAPFILSDDLVNAFDLLKKNNANFVYPVTEYPHPIQRAMRMLESGAMEFYTPEHELTRTQDLDLSFHDAGQFYWGKSEAWLDNKKMHTDGIGMKIPHWRVVDIDTADDWIRAEKLFHLNNS